MLFPGATELVLLALVVAMVRLVGMVERRRLLEEEKLRRQRTLAAPAPGPESRMGDERSGSEVAVQINGGLMGSCSLALGAAVALVVLAGFAASSATAWGGFRPGATASVFQAGAGIVLFLATAYFLYLVADRVKRLGGSTLPAHLLWWTWLIPLVWVVLATIIGKQSAEFLRGRTNDARQRQGLSGLVFLVPSHAVFTLGGYVTFSAARMGDSGEAWFGWALMLGAGFALVSSMAASVELSVENAFRDTKGPRPLALLLEGAGARAEPAPPTGPPVAVATDPVGDLSASEPGSDGEGVGKEGAVRQELLPQLATLRELHNAGHLTEDEFRRLLRETIAEGPASE